MILAHNKIPVFFQTNWAIEHTQEEWSTSHFNLDREISPTVNRNFIKTIQLGKGN